jgi:hypothetical protein
MVVRWGRGGRWEFTDAWQVRGRLGVCGEGQGTTCGMSWVAAGCCGTCEGTL